LLAASRSIPASPGRIASDLPVPPNAEGDLAVALPHVADSVEPGWQDVLGKLASILAEPEARSGCLARTETSMRGLIVNAWMSLDGAVQAPTSSRK
jgi:hypothetical protein